MRWPWHRKCTDRRRVPVMTDLPEATAARQHAEEALARAHSRTAEIREVTTRSRAYARRNHFAELIIETFRGGR